MLVTYRGFKLLKLSDLYFTYSRIPCRHLVCVKVAARLSISLVLVGEFVQ